MLSPSLDAGRVKLGVAVGGATDLLSLIHLPAQTGLGSLDLAPSERQNPDGSRSAKRSSNKTKDISAVPHPRASNEGGGAPWALASPRTPGWKAKADASQTRGPGPRLGRRCVESSSPSLFAAWLPPPPAAVVLRF